MRYSVDFDGNRSLVDRLYDLASFHEHILTRLRRGVRNRNNPNRSLKPLFTFTFKVKAAAVAAASTSIVKRLVYASLTPPCAGRPRTPRSRHAKSDGQIRGARCARQRSKKVSRSTGRPTNRRSRSMSRASRGRLTCCWSWRGGRRSICRASRFWSLPSNISPSSRRRARSGWSSPPIISSWPPGSPI